MKIALHFIAWAALGYVLLSANIYQSYSGEFLSLEEALKTPEKVLILDVSGQDLEKLPEGIGKMVNMTTLRVSYNNLKTLPPQVCQLSSLRVLKAGYNQLESLPDCIGELILLKEMRVGYNQLHQLPSSITALSSLRRLHIGYNPLHELPENFADYMRSLQHLGCNETNIPASDLRELSRTLTYTKVKF